MKKKIYIYIYICIHLNTKLGSVNISTTWNLLIHLFLVGFPINIGSKLINKSWLQIAYDCFPLLQIMATLPGTSLMGLYISDLVKPRNNTREDDHIGPKNWSHRFIHAGCLLKFIDARNFYKILLRQVSIVSFNPKCNFTESILVRPGETPNRLWKPFSKFVVLTHRPKRRKGSSTKTSTRPSLAGPNFPKTF